MASNITSDAAQGDSDRQDGTHQLWMDEDALAHVFRFLSNVGRAEHLSLLVFEADLAHHKIACGVGAGRAG